MARMQKKKQQAHIIDMSHKTNSRAAPSAVSGVRCLRGGVRGNSPLPRTARPRAEPSANDQDATRKSQDCRKERGG